ncbi:MAG: tetratricopeptide repeat protein [Planctomycetota bacterium]|nr:tetratricopeptide repeat protein [Planctomycetota bacterium]
MDASSLFAKAQAAAKKGAVDEAIELWQQGLAADPANLAERKKLREFELRSVKPKAGGLLSRSLSSLKSLGGSKNPKDAMIQAEKALASNPKDTGALASLGQAAAQLGDYQTAIWSLQMAAGLDPKDGEIWKALGHAALGARKPDLAIEAFKRALAINPKDYEAEKGAREAHSAKVMAGMVVTDTKGGLTERESAQAAAELLRQHLAAEKGDAVPQAQAAATAGRAPAQPPQQAQAQTQTQAREQQGPAGGEAAGAAREYRVSDLLDPKVVIDPEERRRQLEIYEYLIEKAEREEDRMHLLRRRLDTLIVWQEYGLAEIACNELYELAPDDPRVLTARGNIREALLKAKVEQLKESKAPEDDIRKAEKEYEDFRLENLRLQIELKPSEGGLRIEYGRLLFERERYAEAAAAFQGATLDQKLAPEALYWLGRCFHHLKLDTLCERVFREAIEKLGSPRSELAKQMRYTLAGFREEAGDWKGAFEEYAAIVQVDVAFQDALQRLQKVHEKLTGGG